MAERFTIISLGCAKNLVDSEVMVNRMLSAGFRATKDVRSADVVIINTCSFIEKAREEAREVFGEVERKAPAGAALIVAGCYGQMAGDRVRRMLPRAGAVLGTAAYGRVVDAVRAVRAGGRPVWVGKPGPDIGERRGPVRLTARHVAYTKIADGCSHKCTFCVIPGLRGAYRSRARADVTREAEELMGSGARELILIAQDTSAYGRDTGGGSLAELLLELDALKVPWIRVLYLNPAAVNDELLGAFGQCESVLPYFDVPLQHASPRVLKLMGRPAKKPEETLDQLREIRERVPGAVIRTTFLVGFPGETWADFETLMNLAANARFDHLGAFEYSAEEGTPAARLPERVPDEVTRERYHKLMNLQREIVAERNKALVGTNTRAIIDRAGPDGSVGRVWFQAPETDGATFINAGADGVRPGAIVAVTVTGSSGYDFTASVEGGNA